MSLVVPGSRAEVLGIIPCRGGSKGIPHKNIAQLAGRPLVEYTIVEAKKSRLLTRCYVSTEDAEIAETVSGLGCKVLERPPELATDETPTLPVIEHALEALEAELRTRFDYVVILQATTPLRTSADIDIAIDRLIQTGADSVVSVCEVGHVNPYKIKRIETGRLVPLSLEEPEGVRRQELSKAYIRNGAIYAVKRDTLVTQHTLFGGNCRPYIMPPERSFEVDTPLDLLIVDALLRSPEFIELLSQKRTMDQEASSPVLGR